VAPVREDLFVRLFGSKLSRGAKPPVGVGAIEEATRPSEADGIAHEVVASNVPFNVLGQVCGLSPEAP
jgi:hypothetical protein